MKNFVFHKPILLVFQLCILFTFILIFFTGFRASQNFADYGPHYYTTIRNWLFGDGHLYLTYPPSGFSDENYVYNFPPLTSIFLLPFVLIPDYQVSVFLWLTSEILLSLYLLKLILDYLDDKKANAWMICAMFGSIEWLFEINCGNISLNMLMLVFISLFKLCTHNTSCHKFFWAFVLGFSCSFKFFPLIFLILLWVRKKYFELIIVVISFLLFISSYVWTGVIFDQVYLNKVLSNIDFRLNSIWYQFFSFFISDSNLIWLFQILVLVIFSIGIFIYLNFFCPLIKFSSQLYVVYSVMLLIIPMPQSSYFLGSFLFIFFLLDQKSHQRILIFFSFLIYFLIPGAFYLDLWRFLKPVIFYPNKFAFVILLQLFNLFSLLLSLYLIGTKDRTSI